MGLKIEIKGVEFENKGAALMLVAILEQLDRYFNDYDLVLNVGPLLPYKNRIKLGAYQKLTLSRLGIDFTQLLSNLPQFIKKQLFRFGIVTEKEVDVILDASGFAYGDQWSPLRLERAANEARRFKQSDRLYILLPQALGAFTSKKSRELAAELFENSQLAYARDSESLTHCKNLNSNVNLKLCPDFTVLVEGKLPKEFDSTQHQFCIIPNSKMLSDKNQHHYWKEHYIEMLIEVVQWASIKGYAPFMLNHEGEKDRKIIQNINDKLKTKIPVIDISDPVIIKGIIGQSRYVMSSRYHGCVSALTQGVKTLATGWSHKYEALFDDFGCSDNLMPVDEDKVQWIQRLEKLHNDDQHLNGLISAKADYQRKTEQMWQEVFLQLDNLANK
jgi:polysaccharide pyruvyl transferase WcaK-like protein